MSQVRATRKKANISSRYARAAKSGLPALQKLEAQGSLPHTEQLEPCPSRVRPGLYRSIMHIICVVLVKEENLEALQWLQEGGYTINKRVLTGTVFNYDQNLFSWLREHDLLDEGLWAQLEKSKVTESWSEM
jgi:hypothetical protein